MLCVYIARYRGYHSHELLQLCNNLDLAVREAIAFLILITQISSHAKSNEIE
nr:MAG TPA: hypothetical protein [Caudoviricetes sp.]DAK86732.1 MAG TPA: hypothetical protein [Caudoviricetes sp.]